MAARQATKATARSSVGSPALGSANSSRIASTRRLGSSPLSSVGTARSTTASAPNSSNAKPSRSSGWRQRPSSARAAGPRSSVSTNSSACEASGAASSCARTCSKMTRSWTTCWSRKKTSSSVVATMKVSCTWPSTRPNRVAMYGAGVSWKSAACSLGAAPAPSSPVGAAARGSAPSDGTTPGRRSASCSAATSISCTRRGWRKRTQALVGCTLTSTSCGASETWSTTRGNRSRGSSGL